jgi:hypothetical protein
MEPGLSVICVLLPIDRISASQSTRLSLFLKVLAQSHIGRQVELKHPPPEEVVLNPGL